MNRKVLGWGIAAGGVIVGAAAIVAGTGVIEAVAVAAVIGAIGRLIRG